MDELIQVDPKLFVTCRLCLEDFGQYQIVPSVQQQIKYCFDIDVEPFDGLPQLICMKCKNILNNFHTVKTTYCEKQTNLRSKVIKKDDIICIHQQQDTVSSSQQASETAEPDKPTDETTKEPYASKKQKLKRKRLLQESSSSSDSESEKSFQTSKSQKTKLSKNRGKSSVEWQAGYKKLIACKLCNSFWSSPKSFTIHNRSHDLLREKYKNMFNKQCTVSLIKIDNKPNLTGLSKMIVHSSNKIVEFGNSYFYTIYSKDDGTINHSKSNILQKKDKNNCLSRESSDDEEKIAYKSTQRKRRLISRSSNETVVIASNSNKILSDEEDSKSIARNCIETPINNDQCINIDDSSDSESEQGKLEKSGKVKQPIEAKFGDYKIIHGIIAMCVKSYHTKNDSGEVDTLYNVNQNKKKDKVQMSNESQLKHKLLSIGRKVINKQGFSCTGLLRFMEHKSLDIVWIAKARSSHPKETNYIRILTKLRGDLNSDDDLGWISVSEVPLSKSSNSVPVNNSVKVAVSSKTLSNIQVNNEPTDAKIAISLLKTNFEASQPVRQINNQAQLDAMPATLSFLDSKASTSDSKKLLNANPVANPKKLPKKLGNEARSNKIGAQPSISNEPRSNKMLAQPCIDIEARSNKIVAQPSIDIEARSNKIGAQPSIGIEASSNKIVPPKSFGYGDISNIGEQQSISDTATDDNNFCLPIITSTTSLATIPNKEQTQEIKNSASSEVVINTEIPATPRIKVKPASELMSERTLDRMKEQATAVTTTSNMFVSQIPHVWPHQNSMNVFVPNIAPQLLVSSPPIQIVQLSSLNNEIAYQPMPSSVRSNTKTEYVILDTTDFPNTKTESPIKYVKDLLQLHNLFLLEPKEITSKFICLIRFKVVFKQESQKDSTVVLCLALLCYNNNFCLQVRDRSQEIIDITKISANWQWEIIRTYRGDVSDKVLQNARKFGQEMFDLTKNFFCLLKSIKCHKPFEVGG